MKNKVTSIILAAGSGSRMKSDTKKQFMEIKGKPVIWYSLFEFEKYGVDQIILVTGEEDINYCKREIVDKYNFTKVKEIVAGGKERYDSVYNGLQKATGDIILIHDGARPLINKEIIDNCIAGAEKYKACVAGMPVKDTIKIADENNIITFTPDRRNTWITQTPQAFQNNIIRTAYDNMQKMEDKSITDDAMVVEKYTDCKVRFVNGSYSNIKITTIEDIKAAEALMSSDCDRAE
jgi:2-C-methyl-D-erythritol 4-phosphate cytidylyltransferase